MGLCPLVHLVGGFLKGLLSHQVVAYGGGAAMSVSANDDMAAMSANGDTHDPLCGPPWSYGRGGHCEGCDLIAKVRADERDRIEAAVRWFHDDLCDVKYQTGDCSCGLTRFIRGAVRGES